MSDLKPTIAPVLAAFGVPATVLRPGLDAAAFTTTIVWLPSVEDAQAFGDKRGKVDPFKVVMLARSAVDTVPAGTRIVAAERLGGTAVAWTVARVERAIDPDEIRVVVRRADA